MRTIHVGAGTCPTDDPRGIRGGAATCPTDDPRGIRGGAPRSNLLAPRYPRTFPLDPNGKPAGLRWLWVALLPACDVDRLLRVFTNKVQPTLSADERKRNRNGPAELLTAVDLSPYLGGDRWRPLALGTPLQGSVRPLDGVAAGTGRIAYPPRRRKSFSPPSRNIHVAPAASPRPGNIHVAPAASPRPGNIHVAPAASPRSPPG